MSRDHFFYTVRMIPSDSETYQVKVEMWYPPVGMWLHLLFWFHTPVQMTTDETGPRWFCMECVIAEHDRLKSREVKTNAV